jgi:hypothetical protein
MAGMQRDFSNKAETQMRMNNLSCKLRILVILEPTGRVIREISTPEVPDDLDELAEYGNQTVIEVTQHECATADEVRKVFNEMNPPPMGRSHRYSVVRCPVCFAILTTHGLKSGVLISGIIGEQEITVPSVLDENGVLVDVNRIVANGYHGDTLCRCRGLSLSDEEVFEYREDDAPEQDPG